MTDSTRPIRALIRGLDALSVLNLRDGATVSEIAAEISLPRTTTYRILETLSTAGYVFRDPSDERYRLTIKVRRLAHGFTDEAWVSQLARPRIAALCEQLLWPTAIATRSGTRMLVREASDRRSAGSVERIPPGGTLPLLTSASGRVYLAHCPGPEREALLQELVTSSRDEDALAHNPAELQRLLEEARTLGFATAMRSRRGSDEMTLAVPVMSGLRVAAALSVRFTASAVPAAQARERFLGPLRETATRIGKDLQEAQPGGATH